MKYSMRNKKDMMYMALLHCLEYTCMKGRKNGGGTALALHGKVRWVSYMEETECARVGRKDYASLTTFYHSILSLELVRQYSPLCSGRSTFSSNFPLAHIYNADFQAPLSLNRNTQPCSRDPRDTHGRTLSLKVSKKSAENWKYLKTSREFVRFCAPFNRIYFSIASNSSNNLIIENCKIVENEALLLCSYSIDGDKFTEIFHYLKLFFIEWWCVFLFFTFIFYCWISIVCSLNILLIRLSVAICI